jgi:hypothetical protein
MDDIVRHTALRLKLHNVSGTVIHHIALLKRSLDQKGFRTEMVNGWCVIEETKEACEHYWLRDIDTGLDIDIGFAVAKLRNAELMALRPVLLESLPPGLNRSDSEETLIRAENRRLFDLYQSDPKAFWREAPKDVSSFHVK